MTDYAALRRMMVDTQVRPSDVTKFPIIDALLTIPREVFAPAGLEAAAYVGENLPIGDDRVLLEPRSLAKLLDGLAPGPGDLALLIGAGTGYTAAVLARMAEAVVALEEDPALAAEAEAAFARTGVLSVVSETGPLAEGAPQHGPYDVILIEGAVRHVPAAIEAQLKDGGRIGAIFMDGELGEARIGIMADGRVNWRHTFNASAPVLNGFESERSFVL